MKLYAELVNGLIANIYINIYFIGKSLEVSSSSLYLPMEVLQFLKHVSL